MSSLYETKFDVIYRKLLERKLNLKKQFDEAYSRDDFQSSMAVMEDIQKVMKSLSSMETLERPFKETARVASRIEEMRVNLEILLESIGKEIRNLDGLQDILTRDLGSEVESLLRMFREEDGRNFHFEFDKFTAEELMALMQFERSYFPSRKDDFDRFLEQQKDSRQGPPPDFHSVDWTKDLPVVAGVALAGSCILEKEEAEEEEAVLDEEEAVIDHGVEDLSEFSRQNEIPQSHLAAAAVAQAEPDEPVVADIAFSEPEDGITSADVQAYAMEMAQAQEAEYSDEAQYADTPAQESAEAEYAAEEYVAEDYPAEEYSTEEYAAEEYASEEYASEEYPVEGYADTPAESYVEETAYSEGEYADADYTAEGYAPEEYAAAEYPAEYTTEEYSTEYAESGEYQEPYAEDAYEQAAYTADAEYADPAAEYADPAVEYAEPEAYSEYAEAQEYAEPVADYADPAAYSDAMEYSDTADYSVTEGYDSVEMSEAGLSDGIGIEYPEPVSDGLDVAESLDVMVPVEAEIDEASLEISLEPVAMETEGIEIDLEPVALEAGVLEPTQAAAPSESDDFALDIDDIQIDLDNLG